MNIREARPDDCATIADFNRALAAETEDMQLDEATIRRGVDRVLGDRALGRYWVAEIDGELIGQIMVTYEWSDWRNGPMWWIQSVYVAPSARRRGVFKALYQRVRENALAAGATALRLYVVTENVRAQKTYEALGMHRTDYVVMHEALG